MRKRERGREGGFWESEGVPLDASVQTLPLEIFVEALALELSVEAIV